MEGPRIKLKDVPPINSIVLLTWGDAWYMEGDTAKQDPLHVHLVGFVYEKTKYLVKIMSEINEFGDYRYCHSIPMKMIESISVLGKYQKND